MDRIRLRLKLHYSSAIISSLDSYLCSILRQQVVYKFGPFEEAERAAIEIVFVSHIVYFLQFLDAIEVEMVN